MGPAVVDPGEAQLGSYATELAHTIGPEAVPVSDNLQSRVAENGDGTATIAAADAESLPACIAAGSGRETDHLATGKGGRLKPAPALQKPVKLLDLPIDILREIINQLPHTNDLTALALCHSILHNLAIPCIYSRFDIVWPDVNTNTEARSGVDALTYGLATLVMHQDVFGESQWQKRRRSKSSSQQAALNLRPLEKRRRGNYYAQYTKKFSLGNGPLEYVNEYLITKESGKMLGTLVALAVARMRNLEAFVWDMPTGVLRDVWLALSSLEERDDDEDCKLERVWVRWHDNSQLDLLPPVAPNTGPLVNMGPPPQMASIVPSAPPNVFAMGGQYHMLSGGMERVEHPTFSVLPPLKSLSVLEIDELPYLDELSILIARSQHKLRTLRIGIALQAEERPWAQVWDNEPLQQVDYTSSSTLTSMISECRLGGVIGVLVGRLCNMRNNSTTQALVSSRSVGDLHLAQVGDMLNQELPESSVPGTRIRETVLSIRATEAVVVNEQGDLPNSSPDTPVAQASTTNAASESHSPSQASPLQPREPRLCGPYLDGKLKLDELELERVALCIPVLLKAFDWSLLSSLTLLSCSNHESLWRSLRHTFAPSKSGPSWSYSPSLIASSRRQSNISKPAAYALNLKHIHTNTASLPLMHFIRDALAPNSLEVFFLQGCRHHGSNILPIETIYKCVLRKHKKSLKKLLINSSEPRTMNLSDQFSSNDRWRTWMMNREILSFMTSGKMISLREIGFVIGYKDWHYFLQRLPYIPHVRSLYIPHIADHPHHEAGCVARELAYQIVDIVTLRTDIELCYVGINNKCFEILEAKAASTVDTDFSSALVSDHGFGIGIESTDNQWLNQPPTQMGMHEMGVHANHVPLSMGDDDDDDAGDEAGQDAGPLHQMHADDDATQSASDGDDSLDDDESEDDDEVDEWGNVKKRKSVGEPTLRLREILFYDDKVAVFKARHGRL